MGTASSPHDFASRLREVLETRGVTRKQLALTVGVSQNTVTSWARGRYRPGHRNLARIAAALEMTLDDLHESGVPPDSPGRVPRGPAADDEARRVVGQIAADLDASLQTIGRVTPDLMRALDAARAFAERATGSA